MHTERRLLRFASPRLAPPGKADTETGATASGKAPGALAGGLIGWLIIRPVNAALGWFFRGFNRYFDRVTALYGWGVGKALRLSAGL